MIDIPLERPTGPKPPSSQIVEWIKAKFEHKPLPEIDPIAVSMMEQVGFITLDHSLTARGQDFAKRAIAVELAADRICYEI